MGTRHMSTWADHAALTASETDQEQLLILVEANLEMLANRMKDRGFRKLSSALYAAQEAAIKELEDFE